MPFREASRLLAAFTRTAVSEPTVRRQAEAAGAAYVALQAAEAEALERAELAAPPPGPAVLQLSVDGAMVPLVGGTWAEVKTLAVGLVEASGDGAAARATQLSYFSRRADHETFARLATVETARRHVAGAGVVVALCDGAAWAQAFVDYHRPDAVRILDWCHATGHLGQVASACFADPALAARWLAAQTRELLEGDPDRVLGKLRGLRADLPAPADPAAQAKRAALDSALHYLETRRAQIAYAAFRAAGYPIGSGAVERANKLVVEARRKGAGMHWAEAHVDPMVALRTVVCADRWGEAWPQIAAELRRQARARLRRKRRARHATAPAAPALPPPPRAADPPSVRALPVGRHDDPPPVTTPPPPPRRAHAHPWRRYPQPATAN